MPETTPFRPIMKSYVLLPLLSLALLSACTTNPMTGRSQLSLVSEKSAITQSASAYSQMVGEMAKKGQISRDPVLTKRVEDITNRLITQAMLYRPETRQWAWSMQVIDDPKTVNAFCMAGGKMAIYTGLIEKIKTTDDELAQVIGHEIAHALAGHTAEKMSVAMATNVGVAVIAVAAGQNNRQRQDLYNAGAVAAMAAITLPNSRDAETEADKLGIELAARAGYDPKAAVTLWQKMMAESKDRSRNDFLSTHPAPAKRIDFLASLEGPMTEILQDSRASRSAPPRNWLTGGSNERLLADQQGSVEQAQPASPLAFYTPEFAAFQKGETQLSCESSCAPLFFLKQGGFKESHDKKDWRTLAQDVIKLNYKLDLNYLYLSRAAQGLGFMPAANKYLQEARRLSSTEDFACAKKTLGGCSGIDVGKETAAADSK